MAIRKTSTFLPAVFQTDANKKFLNATLDQLVSEPDVKNINGYIGRRFAPGFQGTSTYVTETTPYRSDYQLEPSLVYKNPETEQIDFFSAYPDLLVRLNYFGANVSNQNSFFESDYYSYNPRINADAFINFSQYYWVPNGPDPVPVIAGDAELEQTYYVFPNPNLDVYYFSGYSKTPNPDIVLARGGNYQFIIDQPGKKFYIQTEQGLSGTSDLTNLSTREILGVTNNGTDKGTIYFNVPASTAQDTFINMPIVQEVDLATTLNYSQLQGQLLSDIKTNYNGIDGQSINLAGKFLIFTEYTTVDADWTANSTTVPIGERYGIWLIELTPTVDDFIINLVYYRSIPINNKVSIQSGIDLGNTEWYTSIANRLNRVPVITAPLNVLYYQDSENPSQVGVIRLVDIDNNVIDVDSEILNKTYYVAPNGVTFTNGLKIVFDNAVIPAQYKNNQYYVEGVGTGIKLIKVNDLITNFESSASNYSPESNFVLYANATLNSSKDELTITTTDFPDGINVKIGEFPNTLNSYIYSEQDITTYYPYRAGKNELGIHESIKFSSNTIAVSIPGILINGVSNEAYVPGQNGTTWHYDTNFTNLTGQDQYGGLVNSKGEYYYTSNKFITSNAWGNVSGFTTGYTHPDGHSKIIGFAADGYPIYGPYGYVNPDPDDATNDVKIMSSGYYANISLSKYRPSAVEVRITTDATATNVITVASTNGINPGMRITKINGTFIDESNRPLVLNNALKTAVGLEDYLGDFTVQLDTSVTYPSGTIVRFEFLPGTFIEDMVHQSIYPGAKPLYDLDIYNGRFCKTPDFPNGTYAYFTTFDYPWIIGPSYYGSTSLDVNSVLGTPDYILISRASRDLNPWTRKNRWFHKSVLEATEKYLNKPQLMLEDFRAKRPIVEFDADIQLYNFGKTAKAPVDIFDTRITLPFNQAQGQLQGFYVDGVLVTEGMRLIFAADVDPRTQGKIWVANFEDLNENGIYKLKLVLAEDGNVQADESIIVLNGLVANNGDTNKGKSFYWTGTNWIEAQQKTELNQAPYFDVFDDEGISFSDPEKYPSINSDTKFSGTKIFAYKEGSGQNDPYLNFPLSYRNFQNIGDIEFENTFETQIFQYKIDKTNYTKYISTGFLNRNNSDGTTTNLNVWTNTNSPTRQMQDLAFIYDGQNSSFTLDIKPKLAKVKPNFLVYANYKKLQQTDYQVFNIPGDQLYLNINPIKITAGDRIDVLIYSDSVSKIGYYQVPDNLNLNSLNQKIDYPTLGEMRNHIGALSQNSLLFTGSYPGVSNLRDLYVENQAGTIVQQSAPINYAMMFLGSEKYSFINAIQIAKQEYSKFKNKFLQIASQDNQIDQSDPVFSVDYILKQINVIKDKSFPWYYSGMVPYGDQKNIITYTVFNPLQRTYEITEQFDNDTVTNKACLIYVNNVQLLYKRDYVFLTSGAGVTINSNITLAVDDVITIVEYSDTDGNWIPETPSKLGLFPKFTPAIYTDRTYSQPVSFLRGHDGSLTKTFGDFRDQLLLELEKRIYNNIKVTYDEKLINIYDSIPGKFRNTGLDLTTFNNILGKIFLNWAATNNLDFVTNTLYEYDNSFSYNYMTSYDIVDNQLLQGSWRAVYQYFYDCQTPHLTPWQMLGFSEEPDWWRNVYGPPPYTSGNKILWTDLQNGNIAQGSRAGIDSRFARPDLLSFIPVNENGVLLPPLGILTQKYDSNGFNNPWSLGQIGPVENAWRNSSEYPFAIQLVMALTKPAKYFAYGINTNLYRYNSSVDQYLIQNSNERITPDDIQINGYIENGQTQRVTGYLNYISDYRTYLGSLYKSDLVSFIRDSNIQLGYKFAGFTDKLQLKVLTEQNSPGSTNQSVLIPDADIDIFLNKSRPLQNLRYSALIIEKVNGGYEISGYDKANPYFTVVVPKLTGKKYNVKVINRTVTYPEEFSSYTINIPYGTKLTSDQQIVNLISGYERYLILQGFRFDFYDESLGEIRNWTLSTKEFLFWTQQKWTTNSVITLSPIAGIAKLFKINGIIDTIENTFYGTKVLNQNFSIIDSKNLDISRENNFCYLKLNSSTDFIGLIDVNVVQYEHVMVLNNKTQFNDIIYDSVSGQRQFRLKVIGTKTNAWTGYLNPPGYVYNEKNVPDWIANKDYLKGDLVEYKSFYYYAIDNLAGSEDFNFKNWVPVDKNNIKNGLLPNFARNAQVGQTFYNVDKVNLESQFDQYGLGLIGFRNRNYLNDLGLEDSSQVKFYQGFIKQKGSLNSLKALGNVSIGNQETYVDINEEWAFRTGTYGSVQTNQFVEFVLDDGACYANPTTIVTNANNSVTFNSLITDQYALYKSYALPFSSPYLLNRTIDSNYSDDILTAGWVNIDDVDYTVYDIKNISNLDPAKFSIGDDSIIWVAKDFDQSWNVYRINIPSCKIISLSNALDNFVKVTTDRNHDLIKNDVVLLKNTSKLQGFYKVVSVSSLQSFIIEVVSKDLIRGLGQTSEDGYLSKLVSLKIDRPSDIDAISPSKGWSANSKVWVKEYNTNKDWAVYNKSEPWKFDTRLITTTLSNNYVFGSALKVSDNNKFAIVGLPGYNGNVGAITNYVTNFDGSLTERFTYSTLALDTVGLGTSIDSGTDYIVAGAPQSENGIGYLFVYKRESTGDLSPTQAIRSISGATGGFGTSVAMSTDDYWLYVGAPEADKFYVYALDTSIPEITNSFIGDGSTTSFLLSFQPASIETLYVQSATQVYLAWKDFGITNSEIYFYNAPSGAFSVKQSPGYRFYSNIVGNAGSQFGYSLSCTTDGDQIIVGEPLANVTINGNTFVNAGAVSVYSRAVESFLVNDDVSYLFTLSRPADNYTKVYLDGELQTLNVDYTLTLSNTVITLVRLDPTLGPVPYPPGAGRVITVSTNQFTKVETLIANQPESKAQLGYSVEICNNSCSIYAGAPFSSYENYNNGAIYRFVNQGSIFGNITGSVQNPSITGGTSLNINNIVVTPPTNTLDSMVSAINNAKIPTITATNVNGYLNIKSSSLANTGRLTVLPNSGNLITQLGLPIFSQAQVIKNPTNKSYDYFGKTIRVGANSDILVVGSDLAATLIETVFDTPLTDLENYTTFDANSTKFREPVENSGAVWIYSYLPDNRQSIDHPGQFSFIQQIIPRNSASAEVASSTRLGAAIAINSRTLLIGAPANTSGGSNSGRVWKFENTDQKLGWDVLRTAEPKVDIDGLIKAYTYSINSQTTLDSFDYIDPAKGKILGQAEQEITYKIDYDPAVYNNINGKPVTTNNSFYWSNQQVGQVWWDLSTVRYVDYEQDSIKYRANNWGRTFPGSSIDIYEWVESSYPPNKYVTNGGDGVPKFSNNEAYVTLSYVDPTTNITTVKYYFWVKNKTTLTENQFGRSIPTVSIAALISNPKSSGIKYFAALRDDTIALFNINSALTGDDTVFHLDYKTKINSNIIHNEYSLLKEQGTQTRDLPSSLINKMIDSVSGLDDFGNPVPDPNLSLQSKLGILIRPRQSMIADRNEAARNVFSYVNRVLSKYTIAETFNLSGLNSGEPYPVANSGAYDLTVDSLDQLNLINIISKPLGYKVLVVNDSSINNFWAIYVKDREAYNWAANTSYSKGQYIVYNNRAYYAIADFTSQDAFTTSIDGSTVLISYRPENVWTVDRVQSYYVPEYWEYLDWYLEGYDKTRKPKYTVESSSDLPNLNLNSGDVVKIKNNGAGKWFIVQVFPTEIVTVGIQNGTIQFTENLWNLADNGMGFGADNFDQNTFDKNPFQETRVILESLRDQILINELDTQFANLFFVLLYYVFDEQKTVDWVFKTSFVTLQQKIDAFTQPQLLNNNVQDFYRQYIEEVKPYSTTIREFVQNYTGVDNFNGYVSDFDVPPVYDSVLQINRSPSGEFLEDARYLRLPQYRDYLFNNGYYISSIDVVDGGSGYTTAPVITVTGSSNENNAIAKAFITNGQISRIDLLYNGSNYLSNPVITISGGNGTGAIARANLKNDLIRNIQTTVKYDRYTYGTAVLDWEPNTSYAQGQILAYNYKAYIVNSDNYTSGSSFELTGLTFYTVDKFLNANDRIQTYYAPEIGLPGKEFGLLEQGIDYPGVQLESPLYTDSGGFDQSPFDIIPFDPVEVNEDGLYVINESLLDTIVTSTYLDTSIGTRPEDIIVDGGPYVYDYYTEWSANTYYDKGDLIRYGNLVYYTVNSHITSNSFSATNLTLYNLGPYASHAPEELLPGRVYDTLELTVYTLAADPESSAYTNWQTNQGIGVERIEVIEPGFGFDANTVYVVIEGGGATVDAEAQVVLDSNGSAVSFSVTSAGTGYTSTPNVVVFGSNTEPIVAGVAMKLLNAPSLAVPYQKMVYKIFKDMNDFVTYYRVDGSSSTTLTQNLSITDTSIHVANARLLPTPGPVYSTPATIFVNGKNLVNQFTLTGNISTFGVNTSIIGTNTLFLQELAEGDVIYTTDSSTITHIVSDRTQKTYSLSGQFGQNPISTCSVYLATDPTSTVSSQLLYQRDYEFASDGSSITISANIDLVSNNVIRVTGYGVLGTIANITSNTSANVTTNPNIGQINKPYQLITTSTLSMPGPEGYNLGVIWINGERIVYNYKNDTTNTLGQLRRGTAGTGAVDHYAGNVVYDGGQNQVVLNSYNYTWTPSSTYQLQTVSYTGLISAFGTNSTVLGVNTAFLSELVIGTTLYDLYGNVIGTVSNITSNTTANLTSNAVTSVSNQEFGTFGTFYSGNTYVRSNLWNTAGDPLPISTESLDPLTTEDDLVFIPDQPVTDLSNARPMFTSNSIQINFIKQGLVD